MATSFTTMLASVYALTNRPDLVNETSLALQNATLKAHRSDYYAKDIQETAIQCDVLQTQQSVAYKALFPQWRAVKYVRIYDNSTPPGAPGLLLDPISPENVLDEYNNDTVNVFYIAGLNMQINLAAAAQYFLIGYYAYPLVDTVFYNSWIADEHQSAIVYEAASIVFKAIGYDGQSDKYHGLAMDELNDLKQEITAIGY